LSRGRARQRQYIIAALSLLSLLVSVTRWREALAPVGELEELRRWAAYELGVGEGALIAARELSDEGRRGVRLTTHLVAPCTSLCGHHESCAQVCQERVSRWSGPLVGGRLLVSLRSKEGALLGVTSLTDLSPPRLVAWDRRKRLLTLSQRDGVDCCERLSVFEAPDLSGAPALRALSAAPPSAYPRLTRRADHFMGPYHAFGSLDRLQISARSDEGRGEVVWWIPDAHFARLSPRPLKVTLPHVLTARGLSPDIERLRVETPEVSERRRWLLRFPRTSEGVESLLTALVTLCLKGRCADADQLAHLAYPQSPETLSYWLQLKEYTARWGAEGE
jgi:hypothetical protein